MAYSAVLPVAGFAMTVHDCKNQHGVRFYGVENGVRKNARETAPNIFFQDAPSLRGCENLVDSVFYGRHETEFQALLTVCVVSGSMPVLRQGLGVELVPHRANICLTRSKAASPGIVFTRPLRTSSRRRHASVAQSC